LQGLISRSIRERQPPAMELRRVEYLNTRDGLTFVAEDVTERMKRSTKGTHMPKVRHTRRAAQPSFVEGFPELKSGERVAAPAGRPSAPRPRLALLRRRSICSERLFLRCKRIIPERRPSSLLELHRMSPCRCSGGPSPVEEGCAPATRTMIGPDRSCS
jgi:hypothetical protein